MVDRLAFRVMLVRLILAFHRDGIPYGNLPDAGIVVTHITANCIGRTLANR